MCTVFVAGIYVHKNYPDLVYETQSLLPPVSSKAGRGESVRTIFVRSHLLSKYLQGHTKSIYA